MATNDVLFAGGRNGYGAKLCNIFSTKFTVETSCKEYGKHFKQSWADNMGKAGEPKIGPAKGDDFTCITFQVGALFIAAPNNALRLNCLVYNLKKRKYPWCYFSLQPDLKRFGMEVLEEDICKVFKRRAYDVAASVKGIKVFLNGEKLNVRRKSNYE